jgi:hypothetical protein
VVVLATGKLQLWSLQLVQRRNVTLGHYPEVSHLSLAISNDNMILLAA